MESSADFILLSAYDERWKKFRSQYKTCRIEFSEEAVHDLRVSARRLLAILDISRALAPHARIQKTRHVIKDLIEDLNELRDVQVMLVEVSDNIDALPELKSFQKYLRKREASLLRAAYKRVKQKGLSEVSKRIKKIRASLEAETKKRESLSRRLIDTADNTYLWAKHLYDQVETAQISTIHRFRLAYKRFRYLAEILHPLIHNYPVENLERMHIYQGRMGDIQDAETFLATFTEYISDHLPGVDGKAVIHFFKKELNRLITEYIQNKDEFGSFWKIEPGLHPEGSHEPVHHTSRNRRGGRRSPVREGQLEASHSQGEGQDEEDRTGAVGIGNPTGFDSEQPDRANDGHGKDSGKSIGR
jgi:CHAD domain-containing protein